MAFDIIPLQRKALNLAGQVIGKSIAIAPVGKAQSGDNMWLCVCHCGNLFTRSTGNLNRNQAQACGCLRSAGRTASHGKAGTKEHRIWVHMRQRCSNPSDAAFKYYGARGITVCKEWNESFSRFLIDMGKCPRGLSIDRIDNDGPYSPQNCRWATAVEQRNNRRPGHNEHRITYEGETLTIDEWAKKTGLPKRIIFSRNRRGLPAAKIFDPYIAKTVSITMNGGTKSVKAWARHFGIPYSTLRRYLKKGESLHDIVNRLASA